MSVILMIWTVVAMGAKVGYPTEYVYDWRPLGEFNTQGACQRAARELGLKADRFRCIDMRG